MKNLLFGVFLLFSCMASPAQNIEKGIFKSPVFLPFDLSGTFGEIRNNHFHSGIDIRTNGQECQVVMAAADGYVSRIKVSPVGFGNVVYLVHPNGFTTVYAHLHHFNDTLEALVEKEQQMKKSFEVDFTLDSLHLRVRQGMLIGFSGNTGGSDSPHLHFEIRNSKTEEPMDPLQFGFEFSDTIKPDIRNVKIYNYAAVHSGYWTTSTQNIAINDSERKNTSAAKDTFEVGELAAFAVEITDKMNAYSGNLGIRRAAIRIDGVVRYVHEVKKFSYDETRYSNACIDFDEKDNENRNFILLHRLPGNNFSGISRDSILNGMVRAGENKASKVEIQVEDFSGNTSQTILFIKRSKTAASPKIPVSETFLSFNKAPVISKDDIKISFSGKPYTYNIYPFECKAEPGNKQSIGKIFLAGSPGIPIHGDMHISIKGNEVAQRLHRKIFIASVKRGNKFSFNETSFADGWFSAQVKNTGRFTLSVDTVRPSLKHTGILMDDCVMKRKAVYVISDDGSGIKNYQLTVDNNPVIAGYDAKSGTVYYYFAGNPSGKKLKLNLTADDRCGNSASLETEVIY